MNTPTPTIYRYEGVVHYTGNGCAKCDGSTSYVELSIDSTGYVSGRMTNSWYHDVSDGALIASLRGTREAIIGEAEGEWTNDEEWEGNETLKLQVKLINNDQVFEGTIDHVGQSRWLPCFAGPYPCPDGIHNFSGTWTFSLPRK
jgi:hypothetical protein